MLPAIRLNSIMHATGTEKFNSQDSNAWRFPGLGSLGCYDDIEFNERFGVVMLCDAHLLLPADQGAANDFFRFIETAMLDLLKEETKTSFEFLVVPIVFAFLATLIILRRKTKIE